MDLLEKEFVSALEEASELKVEDLSGLLVIVNQHFSRAASVYPFQKVVLYESEDELRGDVEKKGYVRFPSVKGGRDGGSFEYDKYRMIWFLGKKNMNFGGSGGRIYCEDIEDVLDKGKRRRKKNIEQDGGSSNVVEFRCQE